MAIYHFSTKIISRSSGKSAVACAAYRSGEKLYDQRQEKIQDYTRKEDILYSEIITPDKAPVWMKDREKLWNTVEKIECRKDSRLAREFEIALPRELTFEQNLMMMKDFINNELTVRGLVVDLAIHEGRSSDGCKQPHAHLMVVEREIVGDQFGYKYRELNKKENLISLRKDFAASLNHHLAINGHEIHIDHRSLKDQGIDLIPQRKVGVSSAFHHKSAYKEHLENARINGERLLVNPEMVLDILTKQQSTFTHNDIARIVNRYTVDGEQFLNVYEKVKASPSLVTLGLDDKKQERFTTQEVINLENSMMKNASALFEKEGHAISNVSLEEISKKHGLSVEQHKAFEYMVANGDLKNLVGYAGTGKSRLLGAAKEAWEKSGYEIIGATLSGIAAENLQASSGIISQTFASKQYAWEQDKRLLNKNTILVIDEAGMLGTNQLAIITEEARQHGAKLVLCGDPQEQLQAISAGAAFRGIIDHTASKIELKEVWRQHEEWQKEATALLSTRQIETAINKYAEHQCIHAHSTQLEAKQAIIAAWDKARMSDIHQTQIMLAFKREDVAHLNQLARDLRLSVGELGDNHMVKTHDGEKPFAFGDKIYFLKNDKELGVKNGTLGTVIDAANNQLAVAVKVDRDNTRIIQFSTSQYNHIDYGYASTIHKGQGGTFDQAFVLASSFLDRHSTNVAMTRHREKVELFWSKEEFKTYEDMTKSLSRDGSKDLAIDYKQDELQQAKFASYRGLDTLWDNFWNKHGTEWLKQVGQTLHSLFIEPIDYLQNKVTHIIEQEKVPEWLKEMRAWADKTFGKEEVKTIESIKSSPENITVTPMSYEELKKDNELRFEKIMKEAKLYEARVELDHRLQQNLKENNLKIEKNKELDFDLER